MNEKPKGKESENSVEAKKRQLFDSQKELLDQFLKNGAIDRRQYETSLYGLMEKMGMTGSGRTEGKQSSGDSQGGRSS